MWFALQYPNIESVTIRLTILFGAFLICALAGIGFTQLARNGDLFKSIKELREERQKYAEATRRLNKKIREL